MSAPAFFQRFGFYVFATAFAQKLEAQGRVPEVVLGGERTATRVGGSSARSWIGNLCIMMNLPQTVGA